jgi:prepilin-type N-terminal cleavage/methylation domain-containing protein
MNRKSTTSKGFTIVELLIVVVVIAILASITIVGYGNVRRTAENTAVLASVSNWEKSIKIYQATTEKLPDDWTCLGTSVDNFPRDDAYRLGPGQCERGMIVDDDEWTSEYKTGPPQPSKTTSTPNLLRQNTSPGSGAMKTLTSGPKIIKGIIYAVVFNDQTQVNHKGAYLFYALNSQACPVGEAHKIRGTVNVCARSLTGPATDITDVIDTN